jgi:hypothetical protein
MSIEHSLADLLAAATENLPPLCNVVVQFASSPSRVAENRWEIPLLVPDGQLNAVLAIHDNPLPTALQLNYPATADALLNLFADERMRSLLSVGESALVQAEPRFSEAQQRLFLNVEAILLVRPWRTFGRRQIDFAAGCSRKHYLSVVKGVRTGSAPRFIPSWQSLAGHVAHDLIEAAALDLPAALQRDDKFWREALSPTTALRLVAAGAVNLSVAVTAMQRGLRALDVLVRSPALRDLLQSSGPWMTETDAFDRGVTLTPDLVGNHLVVELKRQSPESAAARRQAIKAQATGYLAWAMVNHGIDQVVANWRASLVNVHERVAETDRILSITAERSDIARRVLNRHRLVALSDGSWLPPPSVTECTFCEFHISDGEAPSLPPACQFHCQAERGWPCVNLETGAACPLYGNCEEHRRYHDYRKTDLFNRLREDLAAEEEEGELASAMVASDPSRSWGPFRVRSVTASEIRLVPQGHLALVDGAMPGQVFDLRANGYVLARARYRRLRDGDWQLICEGRARRIISDQELSLSATSMSVYPARAQLTALEFAQRAGEPPSTLRYGGQSRPSMIVRRCEIEDVSLDADAIIVDAVTGQQQARALRHFLAAPPLRSLILLGTDWDAAQLPSDTLVFDEFSARHWIAEGNGTPIERIKEASEALAQASHVAMPWDLLTFGVLGGWDGTFDTVMITDANALPTLALARAVELARKRIVLIGSALASGPATEAVSSSRSPLFANLIRQTIDTNGALLPASLSELAIVRLPVRIAEGLNAIADDVEATIPTSIHVIRGVLPSTSKPIEMQATTPLAMGQAQAVQVRARLPTGAQLSYRAIRTLLRRVSASAFDALLKQGLPQPGTSDHSLLDRRIIVEAAKSSFTMQNNVLVLTITQDLAPLSLREGRANADEAVAIVSHAKTRPTLRFVATSPFPAQCRAIASVAHAEGIDNLRVLVPEKVLWKPQADRLDLLLSLAVTDNAGVAQWPYADPGNLASLLCGDWRKIELFCSPAMAEHPLIAAITPG